MLNIKSLGPISIGVPNLEEAQKYYQELFDTEPVAMFKNFKNEGFSKNMGLPTDSEVSFCLIKFQHCNLVLELFESISPNARGEIQKHSVNDLGGPRIMSLQVEDVLKAFEVVKTNSSLEILNTKEFVPTTFSSVSTAQFTLGKEDNNIPAKERVASHLIEKHFFLFRDSYGLIWKIEERTIDSSFEK
ncbi:MAG: hypothetical protein S4CHLAM7_10600 [Chlamydiae bacterium]|nr:hypothetical protein [Chlamydiota bacterium]